MTSQKIQANYDDLQAISSRFAEMADRIAQLNQKVRSDYDRLEGGGWIGRGADSFFSEMQDQVFPALQRLQNALDTASQKIGEIGDKFHEAEETASNRFRRN